MNIEYTKDSILQLVNKLIEQDFRRCEITSISMLVTKFSYEYTNSRFSVSEASHCERYLYWNYIVPSDSASLVRKDTDKYEDFEIMNIDFDQKLKIKICPIHETKSKKTSTPQLFRAWFGKKYNYNLIERTLVRRYEVSFQKTSSVRTKSFEISELEYLTIFENYRRVIAEYEKEKENRESLNSQNEINKEISTLMDYFKVEKQIQ